MNRRVRVALLASAGAVAAMGLLSGCGDLPGDVTSVVFTPADQSGPQVVASVTTDGSGQEEYAIPAGRPGTVTFTFARPENVTSLDACNFTWDRVGKAYPLAPVPTGNAYTLTYTLPEPLLASTRLVTVSCKITAGEAMKTKQYVTLTFRVRAYTTHLYWTDGTRIGRLTGPETATPETDDEPDFITGLEGVTDVAVTPTHIYWTSTTGIGRADLDGTNVNKKWVTTGRTPTALTVTGDRVWYVDAIGNLGDIDPDGTVNYDGGRAGWTMQAVGNRGNTVLVALREDGKPFVAWEATDRLKKIGVTGPVGSVTGNDAGIFWGHRNFVGRYDTGTGATQAQWSGPYGLDVSDVAADDRFVYVALQQPGSGGLTFVSLNPETGKLTGGFHYMRGNGGIAVGPGRDPAPKIKVTLGNGDPVTSYDFGTIPAGTVAGIPVTVINRGNAPLVLSGIALTGPNADQFAAPWSTVAFSCGAGPIKPNSSCIATLQFTPTSAGAKTATARLTGNVNPTGGYDITLTGTATPAESTASPEPSPTSASPAPVVVTTGSLPTGTVGGEYSAALTATGGSGSYTWSVASGTLPAGLSLAAGGTLSGVPTEAGTSTVTVTATDTNDMSGSKELTLVVDPSASPSPPS